MAIHIPCNVEFLDFDGIDDEERNRIRTSLYSPNTSVQLPWKVENIIAQHICVRPAKTPDVQKLKGLPNNYQPIQICSSNHQIQPTYVQGPFHHPQNAAVYSSNQQTSYIVCPTVPLNYHNQFPISVTNPINTNLYYVNTYTQSPPPIVQEYAVDPGNIVPISTQGFIPYHDIHRPSISNQVLNTANTTEVNQFNKMEILPDTYITNMDVQVQVQHNGNASIDHSNTAIINDNTINNTTPQTKSWASLFSRSKNGNNEINENKSLFNPAVNKETNNNDFCPITHSKKSFIDPNCYRMGEYLINHNVDGRTISLQPRGLINRSNYCYINSILQALLACPPVYNLLSGLAQENTSNEKQKPTPIIDGMCRFVKEFQHLPAGMRVNRRNDKNQKKDQGVLINYDQAFEPAWIYKMLNGIRSDSFLVEGRQEDAEEFLGCLLNGLNDEMLDLIKLVKTESNGTKTLIDDKLLDNEVDKEWQVMGPKNKGSVTRRTEFGKTPISDIFGGLLKSRIHRTGDQSTDNIQPFFTLQLNIEKVKTVREALEALVSRNQLEGVTSSKTNKEVEAWQQVTLDELPIILVLHLKCFDFKLDGCTKIVKALEFPIDLKIDTKLLSSKPNTPKEKQYKLFAVVYHDGKEATKGHYITDTFHVGYSSWLRYDDASVKTVQEDQVLNPQGNRVPYLLFYRRSDTIRSK